MREEKVRLRSMSRSKFGKQLAMLCLHGRREVKRKVDEAVAFRQRWVGAGISAVAFHAADVVNGYIAKRTGRGRAASTVKMLVHRTAAPTPMQQKWFLKRKFEFENY